MSCHGQRSCSNLSSWLLAAARFSPQPPPEGSRSLSFRDLDREPCTAGLGRAIVFRFTAEPSLLTSMMTRT
jgi:hypothetical protein